MSSKIDLYQATMLNAWFFHKLHNKKAAMEIFTRKMPANRSYLVAVGIGRIQEYLSSLKFSEKTISSLKKPVSYTHLTLPAILRV